MVIIDLDKSKYYTYKKGFVEEIVEEMFSVYFCELYQIDAVYYRLDEMKKAIEMKIPKSVIFFVKNEKLYYITKDLQIVEAPKDFFEISETAHTILRDCFQECYSEFKEILAEYRSWKEYKSTTSIFFIKEYWNPIICDLNTEINTVRRKFDEILKISLKDKLCNIVSPKIINLYEQVLLASNPIMLIINEKQEFDEIYAITEDLTIEKVSFSLIERELEEVIREFVPEDTDFLVNRIYNFMMMSEQEIKPYIRINKVQEDGMNATLYLENREIPIIKSFKSDVWYTFLHVNHNGSSELARRVRYLNNNLVQMISIEPKIGLREIKKVNKSMFQEVSCYVEVLGKKYILREYEKEEKQTKYNFLYKLQNDGFKEVINSIYGSIIEDSPEYQKLIKESKRAEEEGSYSFFTIKFV